MDIRGKVTHSSLDSTIERTAIRKVSTQTHPRGADATIARWQGQQVVDAETGVFVVGGQFLFEWISIKPMQREAWTVVIIRQS